MVAVDLPVVEELVEVDLLEAVGLVVVVQLVAVAVVH